MRELRHGPHQAELDTAADPSSSPLRASGAGGLSLHTREHRDTRLSVVRKKLIRKSNTTLAQKAPGPPPPSSQGPVPLATCFFFFLVSKVFGFVQTLTGCEDQARLFKDEVSKVQMQSGDREGSLTEMARSRCPRQRCPQRGRTLYCPSWVRLVSDLISGKILVWTVVTLCAQTVLKKEKGILETRSHSLLRSLPSLSISKLSFTNDGR